MDSETLDAALTPQYRRRFGSMVETGRRLVHYTSAENAISIISGRAIWLRNTLFMNDFAEIQYALELVGDYFGVNRQERQPFWNAVDRLTGGRGEKLRELFDGWAPDMSSGTFVCCVSEHLDNEDTFGRLSMWRGYGRSTGVAIVVRSGYLALSLDALGAFSYPIEYWSHAEAAPHFAEIESYVLKNEAAISSLSQDEVFNSLFYSLQTLVLCIKHPGFLEEREWRIIYRPNFQKSDLLRAQLVTIHGAPQRVYALPLEDNEEHNIHGITPRDLVERVIVGPSTHAFAMRHAFVDVLQECGVEDANSHVVCSDIPFRA